MRVLILILSCVKHELNGFNQAIRNTWMPDAVQLGLDCKFFIGNGSPTGEDETRLLESYQSREQIFKNKNLEDPDISNMGIKSDHVILNVPDDYLHSAYKFREACRWALNNKYDYVFQVLTDTFVVPSRLISCGFEKHDYVGTANGERTAIGGGAGMWLSRKAMQCLVDKPVDMWVHDGWTGKILLSNDIKLTHDDRYTNLGQTEPPTKTNKAISCHIANTPMIYDSKVMYDLYKEN